MAKYCIALGVLLIFATLHGQTRLGAEESWEKIRAEIQQDLAEMKRQNIEATGASIYKAACAACHGVYGDGTGRGAAGFVFRPTNFQGGIYKIRTTKYEALPTDEDIIRSIREGLPGTEMISFGELLAPSSISVVAQYIMLFSPRFNDPDEIGDDDVMLFPPARGVAPSSEGITAGRKIFAREECDSCHGEDGDGQGPDAEGMTDDSDYPISMFDFGRGIFKSGLDDNDLFRTITTGLNGTPMESYAEDTTETERWQLVDFIRSLETGKGFFHYLFVEEPSGLNAR